MERTYSIFVCRAWDCDNEYQKFIDLLNSEPAFKYNDNSISKSERNNYSSLPDIEIARRIESQISLCDILFVIMDMYVEKRKWVLYEIGIGKKLCIPILGLPIFNISVLQKKNLAIDEVLEWNTESILSSIHKYA